MPNPIEEDKSLSESILRASPFLIKVLELVSLKKKCIYIYLKCHDKNIIIIKL